MAEDQKVSEVKPVAKIATPPPPAPARSKPGRKPNDRPFKANVRIEFPTDNGMVEVLPGEVATGIPSDTIKPWLEQGIIEEVSN